MLMTTPFHNRFADELGGITLDMRKPQQVNDAFHVPCLPEKVPGARLIAWSDEAAAKAGLPPLGDSPTLKHELATIFSGNAQLPGMSPVASVYGGHQFGHWAGQLGDGRAILLGETSGVELQLKGSGRTPFSRGSDGRAVLRSSVREYVCSEVMHHLGVPSTRALSLCATGADVVRDMFYDGRPQKETGAVVCRTAPSFIRFGHFEIFAARRQTGSLQQLVDFTIRHYFPEIHATRQPADPRTSYLQWFEAVCRLTMDTIVHWMRVGFIHGVMNTDNMSVLGLTIDYGPFGWVEDFDPAFTPNTSDREARYCYGNQPAIARWNLACLANAIYPLVENEPALTAIIDAAEDQLVSRMQTMRLCKLGFSPADQSRIEPARSLALVASLDQLLHLAKMDFTLFFNMLADEDMINGKLLKSGDELALGERLSGIAYQTLNKRMLQEWISWLESYEQLKSVLASHAESENSLELRRKTLYRHNPAFIPRNHLLVKASEALDQGDDSKLMALMKAGRNPYNRLTTSELYEERPGWAETYPGAAALSCSS